MELTFKKESRTSFWIHQNWKTRFDCYFLTLREIQHASQFILAKMVWKPPRVWQTHSWTSCSKTTFAFLCKKCQLCKSLGSSFLFEHPWSASSWNEPCLQQLISQDGCYLAHGDQCMFGLVTNRDNQCGKDQDFGPTIIPVPKFWTRCVRQDVMGRDRGASINRSRMAQKYPLKLIMAILAAFANSIGLPHDLLYAIDG